MVDWTKMNIMCIEKIRNELNMNKRPTNVGEKLIQNKTRKRNRDRTSTVDQGIKVLRIKLTMNRNRDEIEKEKKKHDDEIKV